MRPPHVMVDGAVDRAQPDRDDRVDELVSRLSGSAVGEALEHAVVELEEHGGEGDWRRARRARARRRARPRSSSAIGGTKERRSPPTCSRTASLVARASSIARNRCSCRPIASNRPTIMVSIRGSGCRPRRSRRETANDLVVELLHQRGHGSGLVLEVEVERRAGHAGTAGDVGDVDGVEAALLQVVVQRLEQGATALVARLRRPPVARRRHGPAHAGALALARAMPAGISRVRMSCS